jgi:hypothetical protein
MRAVAAYFRLSLCWLPLILFIMFLGTLVGALITPAKRSK